MSNGECLFHQQVINRVWLRLTSQEKFVQVRQLIRSCCISFINQQRQPLLYFPAKALLSSLLVRKRTSPHTIHRTSLLNCLSSGPAGRRAQRSFGRFSPRICSPSGGLTTIETMLVAPETRVPVIRAENGVGLFAVPGWERFGWLWHGFSTHRGGVSRAYLPEGLQDSRPELGQLNLGFTAADPAENVRENRLRWIEAVTESRETPLRTIRQIHSGVSILAGAIAPETIPEADGLMTDEPGILLGVMTADCIPVLVADPVHRAVAAFHAGWRGLSSMAWRR
jgi:Multi-copper polyphenol oxidoreductase laccase